MCRILFMSRDGKPLRPPFYGALDLPYLTMPLERWPLYPVAQSGATYFVLSEGYSLGGRAEWTSSFLDYCRKTGTFRRKMVMVPSRTRAQSDAARLRLSPAWTMIKWTDEGPGTKYVMDKEGVSKHIQNQADMTP